MRDTVSALRIRLFACFREDHAICDGIEPMGEAFHYHTAPLAEALDWYLRLRENVKEQEKA